MNPVQIKVLAGKLAKAQGKLAEQQAAVSKIQAELAAAIGLTTGAVAAPVRVKAAKPAKAAKPPKARKGTRAPRGAVAAAITAVASKGQPFRVSDVVAELSAAGISSASASVAIAVNTALKKNLIKRVERGLYAQV